MRKFTYEKVKQFIESVDGYKLLSKIYKDSGSKLEIQCNNNHKYEVTWNNFRKGRRCPHCSGKITKTYEEVKCFIESFNYRLLSKEYKNNQVKLEMECEFGHRFSMKYGHFQQGHRCPFCVGNVKKSYLEVKGFIESENYVLLSKEYKNRSTKLEIQCDHGHSFGMDFAHFIAGYRCPRCSKHFKTHEEVKLYAENQGYELLSLEYRKSKDKITLKCPDNHTFDMTFDSFQSGQRCPICFGTPKLEYSVVKINIEKEGYKLVSDVYNNAKEKLTLECSEGHIINVSWDTFRAGHRCLECSFTQRSGENHHNWKGGITPLVRHMRNKLSDWIQDMLKENNYRCVITGRKGNLEVHHVYSFNNILLDSLKILSLPIHEDIGKYTMQEIDELGKMLLNLHYIHKGVPLFKDIHILFHNLYGRGNNTPEQFEEFKIRYHNGEFKDAI